VEFRFRVFCRSGAVGFLLLLMAAWADCSVVGAPRVGASFQLSGKEYVSIAQWAEQQNFESHWTRRDESVQLTRNGATINLAVDSRDARINGVQVWLLFPAVFRSGSMYISKLDLETTLRPVLFPPKNRSGSRVKNICIDPGHGGRDPGNSAGSAREKNYTLLLARELRDQLTKAGFNVSLTRSTDTFIELPDRPDIARKRNADLFVSLHFNAVAGSPATVRGAEVYCLTPAGAASTNARGEGAGAGWFRGNHFNDKNMFLAWLLQKSLTRNLAVEDRGVHRARFAVLREAAMPAVLIEGGFLSNPSEGKKILDPAYRRQMAKAIAEAIQSYKRTVESGESK
jgi:N-acetylmuramoyl-L-alanine amidase